MIYFATANRGKYETVSAVLAEAGVEAERVDLELAEPRSTDVAAVASAKVLEAWEKLRRPCICVDSGFFIPALGGFPAAYVNFVLGTIGTAGIMRLLEGKPRACEFRNGLAYFDGYTSEFLPANLLQAQRDYFGAHMYQRLDAERGRFFHTNWTERGGNTVSGTYVV